MDQFSALMAMISFKAMEASKQIAAIRDSEGKLIGVVLRNKPSEVKTEFGDIEETASAFGAGNLDKDDVDLVLLEIAAQKYGANEKELKKIRKKKFKETRKDCEIHITWD